MAEAVPINIPPGSVYDGYTLRDRWNTNGNTARRARNRGGWDDFSRQSESTGAHLRHAKPQLVMCVYVCGRLIDDPPVTCSADAYISKHSFFLNHHHR